MKAIFKVHESEQEFHHSSTLILRDGRVSHSSVSVTSAAREMEFEATKKWLDKF